METRVWVNALNPDLTLVGALTGVTGGAITAAQSRAVIETGTMTSPQESRDIDWTRTLVQPWREVDGVAWPLGVYVPTVPRRTHTGLGVSADIQLADRTILLQMATQGGGYSLPAGSDVLTAIRGIITWAGLDPGGVTDTLGTTRTDSTWDAGTSALTIINQLLSWHGWRGIETDAAGRYRVRAATGANAAPVAAEFVEGRAYSYAPTWEHEQDLSEIPNVVDVFAQGDRDEPPIRATATNMDPKDPLSLANRSRVSFFVKADVTTQADAQALADRTLAERRMSESSVTISHPPLDLTVGTAARFVSVEAGVDAAHIIRRTVKPLAALALQQTAMNRVIQ